MFGRNAKNKEGCEDCDEYSHGRADAEEEIKEELEASTGNFPVSKFNFEYEKWECHGCGEDTTVKNIYLPNLCNQPLCLCKECEKKLKNTLE